MLGVLATTVGVPYLLLSTTGPLMQAWYARAFATQGVQPYRLYALSNLASMLALLSYPVLVEPVMTPRTMTSTGSGVAPLAMVAFGSGNETMWLPMMSVVLANHHAAS